MRNFSKSRKARRRRGAVAVEVASCLPILFLVLFAGYEFGRANMLHHASESAAYEGARVGIVPGANKDKVEAAAQFVLNSIGARDAEIIVSPSKIKNDTATIKVTVRIPMNTNTAILPFFTDRAVFEGQCEMSREVF